MQNRVKFIAGVLLVLWTGMPAGAHEITDRLSVAGVLSGALQCQELSKPAGADDACEAAAALQPEFSFRPTRHDRVLVKFGFASGDGLNEASPFNLRTWGADLESDVKNINGSGRDYLLEAWYEHVFVLGKRNELGVSLGIIDPSNYLDQNAYANDEYMQFMNPALSNAPNTFFPAYDPGIAVQWHTGKWVYTGVLMDVHQAASPDEYTFYGLQASYRLETGLGAGNYRLSINGDRGFVDVAGSAEQENDYVLVSVDQKLGKKLGVFTRLGWRLDDESISYRAIYTGGVDIRHAVGSRALDNFGIALAYLEGGDGDIARTRIAEAYYRMVFNLYFAVTADVQYMRDQYALLPEAEGLIYSLRATVNY